MAGLLTGPAAPGVQLLAIPSVCLLIAFLGYSSQWLFDHAPDLEPGPLSRPERRVFNLLLLCLWWTYYRACTVDPGRYAFGPETDTETETEKAETQPEKSGINRTTSPAAPARNPRRRHCNKCRRPKPPRAHHCRTCGRCVPRMDHHCPWTGNCVSLHTFPHFLRFLAFANAALAYLLCLLAARVRALWAARHLPAYLGPGVWSLVHLALVGLVAAVAAFALAILLATTVRGWLFNMTMIEGWELERHEALLARGAGGAGGWWDGDEGEEARVDRLEFPYDVGVWRNMCLAMGSSNPLLWFFPFAGGPTISPDGRGTGWEYEENGFNAYEGMWPPADPEKARRGGWPAARRDAEEGYLVQQDPEETKAAFRARQEQDLTRRQGQRAATVAEWEEVDDYDFVDDPLPERGADGKFGWTNSEGDRLRDYGVDEEAEEVEPSHLIDENDDDVPLGELLRRRKVSKQNDEA